jgi:hypothetical protein
MALTQEQINQMIASLQGTSPEQLAQMGGMYRDPTTGQGIQANYAGGGYNPATGDYSAGAPTEYMVSAPGATREASSPFDRYSTAGQYTGTGNYAPATDIEKQLLKYGIALAGVGAAGGMFGGGLGGAASANPAAAGGFNAAVDSQLANAALGSEAIAGYTGAGAVTPSLGGAGGAAAGIGGASGASGGGLLSGITNALPSGITSLVGPAATIAGGLLGSKPQEQSQTSARSIDPRFDNAILGQGGLLGMVQNSLNAQRPKSSALSNITPRGNGFNLFTGR